MAEPGRRGRSPFDAPHPGGPPSPLYLVVVWGPWNWAAVAVSQELLPEAERDETGEGCSPGWRTEGGGPACPSSPPDELGPFIVSPRPFLLPASRGWEGSPGSDSQPGVSAQTVACVGRASSLGEEPLLRLAALWACLPPELVSLWPCCLPPLLSSSSPLPHYQPPALSLLCLVEM